MESVCFQELIFLHIVTHFEVESQRVLLRGRLGMGTERDYSVEEVGWLWLLEDGELLIIIEVEVEGVWVRNLTRGWFFEIVSLKQVYLLNYWLWLNFGLDWGVVCIEIEGGTLSCWLGSSRPSRGCMCRSSKSIKVKVKSIGDLLLVILILFICVRILVVFVLEFAVSVVAAGVLFG